MHQNTYYLDTFFVTAMSLSDTVKSEICRQNNNVAAC